MSEQLCHEKSLQEDSLHQEKHKVQLCIQEMQKKISEHQRSMCSVQAQYENIKEESRLLHQQMGFLSCQLSEKDREITTLKDALGMHQESGVQEDIVSLAQVKSDLDYYKQAFEGKRLELQEAVASQMRLTEDITSLKQSFGKTSISQKAVGSESKREFLVLDNTIKSTEEERESRIESLQQENSKYARQLAKLKDHLMEVCISPVMVWLIDVLFLCTDPGPIHQ